MTRQRLKLVLLESPLEIVPRKLWNHPQVASTVRKYRVKPGEILLDKRLHYHAMANLPQKWKRGRPDIVYITLMLLIDSLLNLKGHLELYIHVYDGRVFAVHPELRPPRHYEGFKRIMSQLLAYNKVPPGTGKPLLWLEANSLKEFVDRHGRIILLWEHGKPATPDIVVADALESGLPLGIGMFPRGDFRKTTLRKTARAYSLAQGSLLKSWTVAHLLLCAAEKRLQLL